MNTDFLMDKNDFELIGREEKIIENYHELDGDCWAYVCLSGHMDIDIVISDHLRYLISAYHNTHSTFVKQK